MSVENSKQQASTFIVDIERYNKEGVKEPFNVTLNWSDFTNNATTVFDAVVFAQVKALSYLAASYGYGSGWSLDSVSTWGPGAGYTWNVLIDGRTYINSGLENIAFTKEANNKVIEFKRVKL